MKRERDEEREREGGVCAKVRERKERERGGKNERERGGESEKERKEEEEREREGEIRE